VTPRLRRISRGYSCADSRPSGRRRERLRCGHCGHSCCRSGDTPLCCFSSRVCCGCHFLDIARRGAVSTGRARVWALRTHAAPRPPEPWLAEASSLIITVQPREMSNKLLVRRTSQIERKRESEHFIARVRTSDRAHCSHRRTPRRSHPHQNQPRRHSHHRGRSLGHYTLKDRLVRLTCQLSS
jgi:hypothetical protein